MSQPVNGTAYRPLASQWTVSGRSPTVAAATPVAFRDVLLDMARSVHTGSGR